VTERLLIIVDDEDDEKRLSVYSIGTEGKIKGIETKHDGNKGGIDRRLVDADASVSWMDDTSNGGIAVSENAVDDACGYTGDRQTCGSALTDHERNAVCSGRWNYAGGRKNWLCGSWRSRSES